MLEIKTRADIERLKTENAVSKAFLDYLRVYFEELRMALDKEAPVDEFSLEEHGPLLILQDVKDCKNLVQIGIEGIEGMLDLTPEFVNHVRLMNGETYWQVVVLCNNEYMIILYVPKPFDADLEAFLEGYIS